MYKTVCYNIFHREEVKSFCALNHFGLRVLRLYEFNIEAEITLHDEAYSYDMELFSRVIDNFLSNLSHERETYILEIYRMTAHLNYSIKDYFDF